MAPETMRLSGYDYDRTVQKQKVASNDYRALRRYCPLQVYVRHVFRDGFKREGLTETASICAYHRNLEKLELENTLNIEVHILPFAQVVAQLYIRISFLIAIT